jgi:hypothetical protein
MSPTATSDIRDVTSPPVSKQNRAPNGIYSDKATTQEPERAKRVVGFHEARTLAGQHMVDNIERLEAMNPALGRSVLENEVWRDNT